MNPDEVRQKSLVEWKAVAPGWKAWEDQVLTRLKRVSDQLIQSTGISPGQSVIDVATGTGEPALTIAKVVGNNGKVVGVDLSPDMIDVAKERAASQGITNTIFQVVKDESLSDFQDASFDTVVCRFGLMFMPEPVEALSAFRRVLKPGGKASVSVWGAPEDSGISFFLPQKSIAFGIIMKTISEHLPDFSSPPPGTPGTFAIPSQDILSDHFLKAGFSDFTGQVTESFVVGQAPSAKMLWLVLGQIDGFLAVLQSKLPNEKWQAIQEDAIQRLTDAFQSGPAKITTQLIVGTGTNPAPIV